MEQLGTASHQLASREQQKEWKEIPISVAEVICYVKNPDLDDGNRAHLLHSVFPVWGQKVLPCLGRVLHTEVICCCTALGCSPWPSTALAVLGPGWGWWETSCSFPGPRRGDCAGISSPQMGGSRQAKRWWTPASSRRWD